jgi:hypothetical protein
MWCPSERSQSKSCWGDAIRPGTATPQCRRHSTISVTQLRAGNSPRVAHRRMVGRVGGGRSRLGDSCTDQRGAVVTGTSTAHRIGRSLVTYGANGWKRLPSRVGSRTTSESPIVTWESGERVAAAISRPCQLRGLAKNTSVRVPLPIHGVADTRTIQSQSRIVRIPHPEGAKGLH